VGLGFTFSVASGGASKAFSRVSFVRDSRGWLLLSLIGCAVLQSQADALDPYALQILLLVAINIILATSLNFLIGETGQFSLCHAALMGVGAYAGAAFTVFGKSWQGVLTGVMGTTAGNGVFFFAALVISGLAAGAAGFLIGLPSLRLRGDYLAIVTLGFGEMVRVLFQNASVVGGPRGLAGIPAFTNLFWAFGSVAVAVYVLSRLVRSTIGLGFHAVRDDEIAAEAMGIRTMRIKSIAFTVSAVFAGVAGCLWAHTIRYISPDGFGFLRSIEIVVMVILGGMGSVVGSIFAAVLLTLLNEWLRDIEQYRVVGYAVLLILLMLLRPQGLLGGRLGWLPWRRRSSVS